MRNRAAIDSMSGQVRSAFVNPSTHFVHAPWEQPMERTISVACAIRAPDMVAIKLLQSQGTELRLQYPTNRCAFDMEPEEVPMSLMSSR